MLALGLAFGMAGCGFSLAPLPAGSVAGRAGIYDYSPSVIQSGDLQQSWWCGGAYNPPGTTYFSDTIQYQSINMSTGVHDGPMTVLGETPGAWDSRSSFSTSARGSSATLSINPKTVERLSDDGTARPGSTGRSLCSVASMRFAWSIRIPPFRLGLSIAPRLRLAHFGILLPGQAWCWLSTPSPREGYSCRRIFGIALNRFLNHPNRDDAGLYQTS